MDLSAINRGPLSADHDPMFVLSLLLDRPPSWGNHAPSTHHGDFFPSHQTLVQCIVATIDGGFQVVFWHLASPGADFVKDSSTVAVLYKSGPGESRECCTEIDLWIQVGPVTGSHGQSC